MQFDKSSVREILDPLVRHKEEASKEAIQSSPVIFSLPSHTNDGTVKSDQLLSKNTSTSGANVISDIYIDPGFKSGTLSTVAGGMDDVYIDPVFEKPYINRATADLSKSKGANNHTGPVDRFEANPILNSKSEGLHRAGSFLTPLDEKVSSVSNQRLLPVAKAANKTVDAIELNDILEDLHVGDMDNSTIHTRVARRDIDMMFCSPDNYSPDRSLRVLETTKFRAASFGELSDIPEVSDWFYVHSSS